METKVIQMMKIGKCIWKKGLSKPIFIISCCTYRYQQIWLGEKKI